MSTCKNVANVKMMLITLVSVVKKFAIAYDVVRQIQLNLNVITLCKPKPLYLVEAIKEKHQQNQVSFL